MKTRTLLTLILTALSLGVPAQADTTVDVARLYLLSDYDLDATTYTYCATTGDRGVVGGAARPGAGRIKTSGSSTTVVSNTASSDALVALGVGDELQIQYEGRLYHRYVTAAASANSITVNSAIDLSNGGGYVWWQRSCGTAATSGWFSVVGWLKGNLVVSVDQLNVTGGIDIKFECRQEGSVQTAAILSESSAGVKGAYNLTAVGTYSVSWDIPYDSCRLGLKIGTADDGGDLTTNLEQISANVVAWR